MKADCHIHLILDGVYWKNAILRHREKPDEGWIRQQLSLYQKLGYTYLRDGGDRWGVGLLARQLAPEYGILYRTPGAPLCQKDYYGGFIGREYGDLSQFRSFLRQAREENVDFIKIMISGLMDFDRFGALTQPDMEEDRIRTLILMAKDAGFSVMAHANGARTVMAAAQSGADSIEHGAYLNDEALHAMAQHGTVWVPTVSTVGNLRGTGRFSEQAVAQILADTLKNIRRFSQMGGWIAPGTDAGAWAVPHGSETEVPLLRQAGVTEQMLRQGVEEIRKKF